MYKSQLQELSHRRRFNLPSYSCIKEGLQHRLRFKSTVNVNGEVFESPNFCKTLREAEHSAAQVALNSLSNREPSSHSLASASSAAATRILNTADSAGKSKKGYPLADDELTITILEFIEQAAKHKQIKMGAKEVCNTLNKGISELVVLAAEPDHVRLIFHIPIIAEKKNVLCVFVPSKEALGRACGMTGEDVVACTVTSSEGSELKTQILELKDYIQSFLN